MKRYYKLTVGGQVLGSYAVPQPSEPNLVLLDTAPNDESKWSGSAWIPDQEKIDARLAEEANVQAVSDARVGMNDLPGWATWTALEAETWIQNNVTDLASAKTALKAMAKAIVYLRDYIRITR